MKWKIGNITIKNQIVFAPMAGVSNKSYRTIIKKMGAGLIYSEMISTMGIKYNSKKTLELLKINEEERPIAIQIFGNDIETFVESAKYIEKNIKPDIIDINMGCPVPKIALKNQAGSALLKNPQKIYEIVSSVVKNTITPITVKIRSGWDNEHINAIEVAKMCEKAGAKAICIHARTRSQGYTGKADWNIIKQVKENVNIPVIGNGDIKTIYDAKRMLEETKCDAIMIGRATLGNPWIIKECVEYIEHNKIIEKPNNEEKLKMIIKHYNLLKQNTNEKQALLEIRSHALWYIKGMNKSKEIKQKIMETKSETEFITIIKEYMEEIK